jgi:hypothetical protein
MTRGQGGNAARAAPGSLAQIFKSSVLAKHQFFWKNVRRVWFQSSVPRPA